MMRRNVEDKRGQAYDGYLSYWNKRPEERRA